MKKKKKISLAIKILIGMILGLICGFIFKAQHQYWTYVTDTVGTVFIRLLKMTILPLILCSIIGGIASLSNLKQLKKIGMLVVQDQV